MKRIAVLADIHGNLPALRAVLAEVDAEAPDALVIGGDVVAGPMVRESLEVLGERPEPTYWISGNSEREALAVYDGARPSHDAPGRAAAWSARALDQRWPDELASWPITLVLGNVRLCHGSPRRDDEILTSVTPEPVLAHVLYSVCESLVVGGHTHRQFVRTVRPDLVYANAGSVGLPYEGRRGAFWMLVRDGEPEMRETQYDFDAALAEMRTFGFPQLDDLFAESLITPADPDGVSTFLEGRAQRD
jgi:predicted phosphodiesterase